jgi:hypothetical protein
VTPEQATEAYRALCLGEVPLEPEPLLEEQTEATGEPEQVLILKHELSVRCQELNAARAEIARLQQELSVAESLRRQLLSLQNELVRAREAGNRYDMMLAMLRRKFAC